MNVSRSVLIAFLLFAGVGCAGPSPRSDLPATPPQPVAEVGGIDGSADVPVSSSGLGGAVGARVDAMPYYVTYSKEQFDKAGTEGRPILLYFWASWCPICRAEEPKIKSIVETMDVPVAGFRVNFDTESELKGRFRIPYQHTTVILNAKGEETARYTGPVAAAELQAAIRAAAE